MSKDFTTPSAFERLLAYAAVTIIGASVLSFFATLIAALVGVSRESLAADFWPVIVWVGYVGLPLGFVLILVLVLVTRRRRLKALNETRRK